MAENLEALKSNIQENANEICNRRIEKLYSLWRSTFGPDICVVHLSRILEHVETFFDEIEQESRERQQLMKQNIDELLEEAEQLKNLLKVNIDLKPDPDTPLHDVQTIVAEKVENLRAELEKRCERIDNYLNEQRLLCDQMNEPFRPLPKEPLPTENEMKEFRLYLDQMHEKKAQRLEYFSEAQTIIQKHYTLMGILPETEEEQELAYHNVQPSATNVTKMKILEERLNSQFEDFKADMDNMRLKLEKLWDFLKVSKSEQARFERCTEYNSVNHLKLYEELQRCDAIKRENMQAYIDELRKNILVFWDMTYKSQEERSRFVHFNTDIFTEDQLELHEMELNDLKQFYTDYEHIFKAFEDRAALWEKMKELDAKANDPGRFANRGGQLLKEEKERKALNSKLPKVESNLINLCREYEASQGKPFTIDGKKVEDLIAEDHERRNEEKNAGRKHPPSAANTPLGTSRMISMRTPVTSGVKNSTARTLVPSASRTNSTRMLPPSSQKSTGTKRRLSPPRSTPAAKRNLLPQIDPSSAKSISRKGFISPSVRRHSLKRQSIKKRKSLVKPRRENIPPKQSETDTTTNSESICYDVFENAAHAKAVRSSMQPTSLQPKSPCTPRIPAVRLTPSTPNTPGSVQKKMTTTARNFQMMI